MTKFVYRFLKLNIENNVIGKGGSTEEISQIFAIIYQLMIGEFISYIFSPLNDQSLF